MEISGSSLPGSRLCKECWMALAPGEEHHHTFRCRDCGETWTD